MALRVYKISVRSTLEAPEGFCAQVREVLTDRVEGLQFVEGKRRSDRKRRGGAWFWKCIFQGQIESTDVVDVRDAFRNINGMNYPRFKVIQA